ncbi:MAG: hypothetical protein K0S33_4233 [Bacteroidetes bacterium]|jgi:hypothetical protein|nr:hypothetical protein [Bacteroidota bacterium]
MNKKTIAAVAIVITSLTATIQAQTAGEYLETVGKEFENIQTNTWDYTRSAAHGKSARKVEKRRKEVVIANQEASKKIGKLGAFNSSTAFRDSALSFLKVNYAVLNEDYAKLVDMEEVAEQSYDLMEAYMLARERADEKLKLAGEMIHGEYGKFAAANNITLVENKDKLTKNMEIAGKVYKHYNEVYLIFFKSYKQEMYLMDAISKGDVNGIEQNKNALAKTAKEGMTKLETVKPYQNDMSIKKAAEQMMKFYQEESEKKLVTISNFFVTKENFEKIKAAFDSKAQSDKQKVDEYNKAVADYNKATNEYNATNQELNSKRSQLLDSYNKTNAAYTDKHVPTK